MSSTQESETGGSYIDSKEALPIHQTAIRIGHPQGLILLKIFKKIAHGIQTGVLKNNLKVWTCNSTGFVVDT